MNTSIFAASVLPKPDKSAASFMTRAAKWGTGIVAVFLAGVSGFMLGVSAVASTTTETKPSAPETVLSLAYFPSQYVNTATAIEDLPAQF